MTAPTAPIDADLGEWDKISYFVLEEDAIWRTQNLAAGGAATWVKVYDPATQFTGGTFTAFVRLRCAPGTPSQIVYALGHGVNEIASDQQPFVLRSENNGLTWSQNWIDEELTARPYTVTYKRTATVLYPGGDVNFLMTHVRAGDDVSAQNPYAMAYRVNGDDPGDWDGIYDSATTINTFSGSSTFAGTLRGNGNFLVDGSGAAGRVYLDDYFGAGGYALIAGININMPKDAARVQVSLKWTHSTIGVYSAFGESWVFWNKPSVIMPKAIDVARANPNVLFVGLQDKIITSTNGGFDWTDCITAHGAYDICIDPQLGGVIYYWSTGGELRYAVGGVLQDALLTGETGGEMNGAFRIARDFNTGKLWAVHNNDLKLRNLAAWSTQKSGLVEGRGLRAFYASPTKLALLDNTDIYLSLDAGATWANKKGGWAAYAGPRTIHLLEAA